MKRIKSTKGNIQERDFRFSKDEAHSGSPKDVSLCGEEDPGSALESIVREDKDDGKRVAKAQKAISRQSRHRS